MVLTGKYKRFFLSKNPSQKRLLFFTRLMAFTEVIFFVLILLFILINFAFGQSIPSLDTDTFHRNIIRADNDVYADNIKTVRLRPEDVDSGLPIIRMNSSDVLHLSFDDLGADHHNYRFRIIHCTFDWKPSDLVSKDYQVGNGDDLVMPEFISDKTSPHYIAYGLDFPNKKIRPIISGNFLLIVFDDGGRIIITRRLMVVDSKVEVDASIHPATSLEYRRSKQEVDFSISCGSYEIENPFKEIQVAIYQNGRTDRIVTGLSPRFVKDHVLDYNYEEGNLFDGGNEFRSLDIRTFNTLGNNRIEMLRKDSAGFHIQIAEDAKRSSLKYSSACDMNGRFITKKNDDNLAWPPMEYCYVEFRLKAEAPLPKGTIYLAGSFTDWQLKNNYRMVYNETARRYEASVFMKQGRYDYEYVFAEDGFTSANESEIEGNHSETENSYMICVYQKDVNRRYDQLIGLKCVSSLRD